MPEVVWGAVGETGGFERWRPNFPPEVDPRGRPPVDVEDAPRPDRSRHFSDGRDAAARHVNRSPREVGLEARQLDGGGVEVDVSPLDGDRLGGTSPVSAMNRTSGPTGRTTRRA
jgi:hypothetical protein